MDVDPDAVKMGQFDYDTETFTIKTMKNATTAAKTLQDPDTNFIQVGKCGFEAKPGAVELGLKDPVCVSC